MFLWWTRRDANGLRVKPWRQWLLLKIADTTIARAPMNGKCGGRSQIHLSEGRWCMWTDAIAYRSEEVSVNLLMSFSDCCVCVIGQSNLVERAGDSQGYQWHGIKKNRYKLCQRVKKTPSVIITTFPFPNRRSVSSSQVIFLLLTLTRFLEEKKTHKCLKQKTRFIWYTMKYICC